MQRYFFFAAQKSMTRTYCVPNMDWNELKKAREVRTAIIGRSTLFLRVFLQDSDTVIFTTARTEDYRELTERTLLPSGPRIHTPNMLYQKGIGINVVDI